MAHTRSNPTLGRKKGPKAALLKNLSRALIQNKRIVTTLAKAKVLAPYVARIITRAKRGVEKNSTHAYRNAFAVLQKDTTKILFEEVIPVVRQSGYTRVIKLPPRPGDAAPMALIELVDFGIATTLKAKSKTRRGRKKEKKATEIPAATETNAAEKTTS